MSWLQQKEYSHHCIFGSIQKLQIITLCGTIPLLPFFIVGVIRKTKHSITMRKAMFSNRHTKNPRCPHERDQTPGLGGKIIEDSMRRAQVRL